MSRPDEELQQRGKITDYHQYEIWRYENDSVDIHTERDEFDIEPQVAYEEACVVARSLGEVLHDAEEVACLRLYDDGLCTTSYREEAGFMSGWKRFVWLRERVTAASYAALLPARQPPGWLLTGLWAVEYAWSRLDRRAPEAHVEEDEQAPAEQPVPAAEYPPNVVPLRPRSR